jgi:hypothetical protein
MRPRNRASRSRQRAARKTFESLPGMVAFYADSLAHSVIKGSMSDVRRHMPHDGALGTTESIARKLCARQDRRTNRVKPDSTKNSVNNKHRKAGR